MLLVPIYLGQEALRDGKLPIEVQNRVFWG
jgi:hypothetical protein